MLEPSGLRLAGIHQSKYLDVRKLCEWLHGYLKNNPNVSEEDRGICDDILAAAKDTKEREGV